MKDFLRVVGFISFLAIPLFIGTYCESQKDPYEIGSHWDYRIDCENGFVYKYHRGATMQVFNSDGTPLRCGKKIY
jgi:hypothetical protein